MKEPTSGRPTRRSTQEAATASGYSTQQIRDLERVGAIPPTTREVNGYRSFGEHHITALRAYRNLAVALGPVIARQAMRTVQALARDDALAMVGELHIDIARLRRDTTLALEAQQILVDEGVHDAAAAPGDEMTITELSNAIGVRSSALRFWEQQGLLSPDRATDLAPRRYSPAAVRDARIVAALRAGGYRIPAIQAVLSSLRDSSEPGKARDALRARLHTISLQAAALLRAGTDIVQLIDRIPTEKPLGARHEPMHTFDQPTEDEERTQR